MSKKEPLPFNEKLFELQHEVEAITKDTKGYNYKYFDINKMLNALYPILKKHRLLLTQPIGDDKVHSIIHDLDSDRIAKSSISLTLGAKPQDLGSEITYYRRYTLQSLLGLRAEDDDGAKTNSPSYKQDGNKPWLNDGTEEFEKARMALADGYSLADIRKKYKVSKKTAEALTK